MSQLTDHCHLDGIFIKYSLTGVHLLAKFTKNFIQEYDRLLSFTWLDLITAENRIMYVKWFFLYSCRDKWIFYLVCWSNSFISSIFLNTELLPLMSACLMYGPSLFLSFLYWGISLFCAYWVILPSYLYLPSRFKFKYRITVAMKIKQKSLLVSQRVW